MCNITHQGKDYLKSLFYCLFFLFTATGYAQLKVDADIRPRFEYRHGFGNLFPDNTEPGAFIQQRTRLNINYANEKVNFGMSVQDVSVWGDEPQITTTDGNHSFSLFQAWVSYHFSKNWSTKLGRQVLSYDHQRILGGLDWAQQGRSHDAALIRYNKKDSFKIDLGFAFNQENVQSEGNDFFLQSAFSYKTMQFLHVHRTWKSLKFSVLLLNSGFQKTKEVNNEQIGDGVRYIQTVGTFITYPFKNGEVRGSTYRQLGADGNHVRLNGYQLLLEADYKPNKVLYGIGAEMLSGTNQAGESQNKSFFPLYGTNHKFNGFMDYFYVGNHQNNVGLNDLYAKLVINTGKKSNFLLKGHYFLSNADLLDNKEKYLGTEVDLVYTLNPFKNVTFDVGYSHLLASESMRLIKGNRPNDNTNHWAWVRLMFKPTLLTYHNK